MFQITGLDQNTKFTLLTNTSDIINIKVKPISTSILVQITCDMKKSGNSCRELIFKSISVYIH